MHKNEVGGSVLAPVQAHIEALNWGGLQDGTAVLSENFVWEIMPTRARLSGRQGYLSWLQTWRRAFPDAWVELVDLKPASGGVFSRYISRGTHAGILDIEMGVVTPTGKAIALPVCDIYEVSHGRIDRIITYFDMATLMRQLGCMPQSECRPLSMSLAN
jgi:steroid delta-isomerase-like uncharacterized protein